MISGVMAFMISPLLDFGTYIGVCYYTRRYHHRVAKLISKDLFTTELYLRCQRH